MIAAVAGRMCTTGGVVGEVVSGMFRAVANRAMADRVVANMAVADRVVANSTMADRVVTDQVVT